MLPSGLPRGNGTKSFERTKRRIGNSRKEKQKTQKEIRRNSSAETRNETTTETALQVSAQAFVSLFFCDFCGHSRYPFRISVPLARCSDSFAPSQFRPLTFRAFRRPTAVERPPGSIPRAHRSSRRLVTRFGPGRAQRRYEDPASPRGRYAHDSRWLTLLRLSFGH